MCFEKLFCVLVNWFVFLEIGFCFETLFCVLADWFVIDPFGPPHISNTNNKVHCYPDTIMLNKFTDNGNIMDCMQFLIILTKCCLQEGMISGADFNRLERASFWRDFSLEIYWITFCKQFIYLRNVNMKTSKDVAM